MDRRQFLTGVAGAGLAAVTTTLARPAWSVAATPFAAAREFDGAVATRWFDQLLRLVRGTGGFSPPVTSRVIGYAGVTLYEAVVGGMPEHRSLAGILNDMPAMPTSGGNAAYHWPSVANAALARMMRLSFLTAPAHLTAEIDALENEQAAAAAATGVPLGVAVRSTRHGYDVTNAVFEWSRTDGGHEGYLRNFPTDHVPPSGPGLWRPTPPAYLRALQPTWGENRPLAMPAEHVGDPGPPSAFSTDPASACYREAFEVHDTVRTLTDEQRAIALFWSDDPGVTATPAGHAVAILTQTLRIRQARLDVAAEAYARLGIALADSFIACWRLKYTINLLRPITYITDHIDASFGPAMPLVTPPFPEYTSGHSVQSGATATVMTYLFGSVSFTDHTHDDRGLAPRSFVSFNAAAAEAAISRLHGGIHYRPAVERGLEQGRAIGDLVTQLPLRGSPRRGQVGRLAVGRGSKSGEVVSRDQPPSRRSNW